MTIAYLALFGAGVASFLAPCVVPLVPAYVGMLAGEVAERRRPPVGPAVLFVAGFAAVFTLLGAFAGRLGSALAPTQQWIARVGGAAAAVFGLVLLGLVGGPLAREHRLVDTGRARRLPLRPLVLGIAFGAAWTPCVGPLLGAALVVAARSGSALHGASLLFVYGAGVGLPFIVAALASTAWPGWTRAIARHTVVVERVAGVTLLVLGLLLASGQYDRLTGPLARLLPIT